MNPTPSFCLAFVQCTEQATTEVMTPFGAVPSCGRCAGYLPAVPQSKPKTRAEEIARLTTNAWYFLHKV